MEKNKKEIIGVEMKLSSNNVSYGVAWASPKDDKEGCQEATNTSQVRS